jgi:hypothetical protein
MKALGRITNDGPHVHDEAIPGDLVPPRQTLLAGFDLSQGDHASEVPLTGVVSASLRRTTHSTHSTIEHRAATRWRRFRQLPLGSMKVLKAFSQVITVLHRRSHQKRPQSRFRSDDLPPIQVGFHRLSAPSDGAQRAQQVLHAEAGRMQPHCIDGEVVPEQQVVTASGEPLVERFLTFDVLADKLRYIERTTLCLTVPINPPG